MCNRSRIVALPVALFGLLALNNKIRTVTHKTPNLFLMPNCFYLTCKSQAKNILNLHSLSKKFIKTIESKKLKY